MGFALLSLSAYFSFLPMQAAQMDHYREMTPSASINQATATNWVCSSCATSWISGLPHFDMWQSPLTHKARHGAISTTVCKARN